MKYKRILAFLLGFLLVALSGCYPETDPLLTRYSEIDLSEFQDSFHHARYQYENEIPPWELYQPDQVLGIAENMLVLQNPDGGWPKNLDYQRIYTQEELSQLPLKDTSPSTLDNRNGYAQVRYLCRVWEQLKDSGPDPQRYLDAAIRGLQWILAAQHPANGGFSGADVDGITYNDDVMTGTLRLLRDVAAGDSCFTGIPQDLREMAQDAYDKGIACILRTQIRITLEDGSTILTAWCQQHSNEEPFAPIWARSFEPPSICSRESFDILKLLMEIPDPDEQVRQAVIAGCTFFDRDDVRIHGKEIETVETDPVFLKDRMYTTDRFLVGRADAADLWARFYALDSSSDVESGAPAPIRGEYPSTLQPVWCDEKCTYVQGYNDLGRERRNGYSYVINGGDQLLAIFAQWKNKHL